MFCFATLAGFFMFFCLVAGKPFPTAQVDCGDIRSSSLALNHYAKTAVNQARNQSTDLAHFSSSLAWMGADDLCDPGSLKQKSTPCVGKILRVLMSYNSAVERISGFECCSKLTKDVKPAVDQLQKDMSKCVKSLGEWKHEEDSHILEETAQSSKGWQEPYLCRYTLERLFSFSILTARVFAVGDPAHHVEGSAQKCM